MTPAEQAVIDAAVELVEARQDLARISASPRRAGKTNALARVRRAYEAIPAAVERMQEGQG